MAVGGRQRQRENVRGVMRSSVEVRPRCRWGSGGSNYPTPNPLCKTRTALAQRCGTPHSNKEMGINREREGERKRQIEIKSERERESMRDIERYIERDIS